MSNKKLTPVILLIFSLSFSYAQEKSGLVRLSKEIDRLEMDARNKRALIYELQREIRALAFRNKEYRLNNVKLQDIIKAKTNEILVLRGEVNDILFDYEKLINEFKSLKLNNEGNKKEIEYLQQLKENLANSLDSANLEIVILNDSLSNLGYEKTILEARNKALNDRIEDLLELRVSLIFAEFNFLMFHSFDTSVSVGMLTKGKTLYLGLRGGFKSHNRYEISELRPKEQIDLIPVTLQLRFPLSRRNFAHKYIDPFKPASKDIKYFGSLDFGYSKELVSAETSYFNRGGIVFIGGVGGIFNFFEFTNAYLTTGFELQVLKRKDSQNALLDKSTKFAWKVGFGVAI